MTMSLGRLCLMWWWVLRESCVSPGCPLESKRTLWQKRNTLQWYTLLVGKTWPSMEGEWLQWWVWYTICIGTSWAFAVHWWPASCFQESRVYHTRTICWFQGVITMSLRHQNIENTHVKIYLHADILHGLSTLLFVCLQSLYWKWPKFVEFKHSVERLVCSMTQFTKHKKMKQVHKSKIPIQQLSDSLSWAYSKDILLSLFLQS